MCRMYTVYYGTCRRSVRRSAAVGSSKRSGLLAFGISVGLRDHRVILVTSSTSVTPASPRSLGGDVHFRGRIGGIGTSAAMSSGRGDCSRMDVGWKGLVDWRVWLDFDFHTGLV